MHADFWIMTFLMTVVALLFVSTPLARGQRKTFAVLVATVPAFAILTYLALGSPDVTSATPPAAGTHPGHRSADRSELARPGSVSSLAAGLAARLREQPDDGDGWLLLAKSYVHLNRLDEARHAYARAAALGETDEELARQVAADDAPDGHVVVGRVSLSPAAAELVRPDDAVFIFARAPGQSGPPVAVTRTSAGAWPLEFRLTDAESMTNGVRLSDHSQVVVTARVSRRGDGDTALKMLEAKSLPVKVADAAPVHLTIE